MSMTVDTSIRIDLHSVEVVQLYPRDMLSLQPLQVKERIIPRLSKYLSCQAFLQDLPPNVRVHVLKVSPLFKPRLVLETSKQRDR